MKVKVLQSFSIGSEHFEAGDTVDLDKETAKEMTIIGRVTEDLKAKVQKPIDQADTSNNQ